MVVSPSVSCDQTTAVKETLLTKAVRMCSSKSVLKIIKIQILQNTCAGWRTETLLKIGIL